MILNDNLLENQISIDYLIQWLQEQKKGGAKFVNIRVNDTSEDELESVLDMISVGDLALEKIQLEVA